MSFVTSCVNGAARIVIAASIAAGVVSGAAAQTDFTYQGQLKSSGSPYSGTADLRFTLYTAASGGSVVGAPVAIVGATVTDGLFTADLDFGATAFNGSPRWLQIEVRTPSNGGAGPYTPLAQRQPVNPTPYAMHAAIAGLVPDAALTGAYTSAVSMTNASNAFAGNGSGLVGLNASNITAGTLGGTLLGGSYGNAVSFSSASNSFTGNGAGLTNLNWSNLVSVPPGFADGIDDVGSGTSQWSGTAGSNIFYNFAGGNVGIGTSSPAVKFEVVGGEVRLPGGTNPSNFVTHFNYSGDGRNYIRGTTILTDSGGQVGIGPSTPHPNARLHVKATTLDGIIAETVGVGKAVVGATTAGGTGVWGSGTGTGARGGAFWTDNGFCGASGDHTASGNYGLLGTPGDGVFGSGAAGMNGVKGGTGSGTANAGVYGFSTASNGNGIIGEAHTGTAAYGVWGRANQGIGGFFSGGTYAVYASGKMRCTTIEIAGGSDLAEPFDVASHDESGSQLDIEPGMVVVIDPANPGALRIATSANDRKVAGIISGANDLAPGMIMKSEGQQHADGDHPVALTGRVWCWCDASTASIEPGDMLTTSDTAGHAMKALDLDAAQGAIIGKAMTPLAAGERGLVLVLVNLQ